LPGPKGNRETFIHCARASAAPAAPGGAAIRATPGSPVARAPSAAGVDVVEAAIAEVEP
jgi:hypothetical protein